MFGTILMLIIMLPVAFLMGGIGIYQIKSPKPAWFYSGEEPPKPENITDLRAWNTKHGGMWVVYGAIILITTVIGVIDLSSIGMWFFMGGILLPIPFMIWWHHRLEKIYLKK